MTIALSCLVCPGSVFAADSGLPEAVHSRLQLRGIPTDTISIYVEDLDSNEIVLDWQAEKSRNPASTLKLLTTLVALDKLGPAFKWETAVYALGEINERTLHGDLLLQGGGDPYLVTERVWQLVRRIRAAGIDEIDGRLLIDDSYFDVQDYDPGAFDQQPLRAYNVAPNALLMNFKVVRYWFEPDLDNNAVSIRLDPALANVAIDNRLTLANRSCAGFQRGISINANEAIDTMTFSGRFPERCERYAMDRTALDHNEFVFGLFSAMWREGGGRFDGSFAKGVAPVDVEPLLVFESLPLADVISRVNKYSNNVMARQVLYTLSAEFRGTPGTETGGREVIRNWLVAGGFEPQSVAIDNGAGLSREARISARDFGEILRFAWLQPYMPEYLSSMALSGLDGTLRDRLDTPDLRGKAHLKTGSLDDVSAIAGYLQSRSGRRFSVVVLHNHDDIHRGYGEEAQAALITWLYEQ